MRVVWTKSADANLQAIHDYIAQTSTDYARRMVQKITNHSKQIAQFPLAQLREVFERPYRIIYRIRRDRIDIIAVVHMSRDLSAAGEAQTN